MKPIPELIYAIDCPNVELARHNLRQALVACELPATWQEWDRQAENTPLHLREFGSPTVLVNGRDVAGCQKGSGNCCRLYPAEDGSLQRAPGVEVIIQALGAAPNHQSPKVGRERPGSS